MLQLDDVDREKMADLAGLKVFARQAYDIYISLALDPWVPMLLEPCNAQQHGDWAIAGMSLICVCRAPSFRSLISHMPALFVYTNASHGQSTDCRHSTSHDCRRPMYDCKKTLYLAHVWAELCEVSLCL